MDMLRFGEFQANSSLRSIIRSATEWHELAKDLRDIVDRKSLPLLDPGTTPIVNEWFVEKFMVPILVGHISYPEKTENGHATYGRMNFTAPLHFFSYKGEMTRSSTRWYRLGTPSPLAERSIERWTMPDG
ncbi:hypothetical protein [Sinorhizobium meliloti]|uniref:hypothetical protein n=1 Tax=Rhizobium meliloti TaxID=382 RepID=UPI000D1F448C|nr:hypothetical protein [Sinorhizobium meliloti]MDW9570899.1 hypothetical protein [Sinorhizobium meliloti]RVK57429.1 hypothetical protein CN155_12550 [Sinorhizobium meliloti]